MSEIGRLIGAEIGASALYVTAQPFSAMAQGALMELQDQGVKVEVSAPQLEHGLTAGFNKPSLDVNQGLGMPDVQPAVSPPVLGRKI
jgi:hypothetical protein